MPGVDVGEGQGFVTGWTRSGHGQSGLWHDGLRGNRAGSGRRLAAVLILVLGLALGACAVPFGPGSDGGSDSSGQTPSDRNQLYLQEQQRQYRQQQFDRVGPSDR